MAALPRPRPDLVTTRRRDTALATHGRLVPVGLFTPAEATAHLQHALAAQGRREPEANLAALARDLGHLPLALSQAAAYLTDTHITVARYRARLADRARHLADLLPEPGALPAEVLRTRPYTGGLLMTFTSCQISSPKTATAMTPATFPKMAAAIPPMTRQRKARPMNLRQAAPLSTSHTRCPTWEMLCNG